MEFKDALQLACTVSLPFILYILNGIRNSIHELRNQFQPLASEVAQHSIRIEHLENQGHG